MKNLEKTQYELDHNGSNFKNLSQKQREDRIARIEVLKNDYAKADALCQMAEQSQSNGAADLEKQEERDAVTGEFASTVGKSNKEVVADNWAALYANDQKTGEITENVETATGLAQDFHKEATDQEKLIQHNNEHMDKQNDDLIKATNNMTKLMAVSNQWCLWGIFVLEVILLFVFIFFV